MANIANRLSILIDMWFVDRLINIDELCISTISNWSINPGVVNQEVIDQQTRCQLE